MRVLVTGGTGVVGKPAVDALLADGHTVRLFSRHARRDATLWNEGVEAWDGNIGSDADVRGALDGCDAALHIAGIVDEVPPHATFQRINVEGTRRLVQEAARAGVKRFVYVSSLGADRGDSDYHRSKLAGEQEVAAFPGNWLVCRPGNVYGPGDQVISLLLKSVRMLPAIPVIGWGNHPFQPVAAADLGQALARAVERQEPARQVLELAGEHVVTVNDVLDELERITDRSPIRLPVPEWMASAGADAADALGVHLPVNKEQITMLLEGNVIEPGKPNALTTVFGVRPRSLAQGLAELADSLPEKLPSEGVGKLHLRRYWADITGSTLDADGLFHALRHDFSELVPHGLLEVGAEPGTPVELEEGATLTLGIPLRGHIQVRVEEVRDHTITCMTLQGHHLAGIIQYIVRERAGALRFEVRSYSRSARLLDQLGMATVGTALQTRTWKLLIEAVVERSGGTAPEGVETLAREMDDREAARVDGWAERLVAARERQSAPGAENAAEEDAASAPAANQPPSTA